MENIVKRNVVANGFKIHIIFCTKHNPMIEVYFDTLLDIIQKSIETCSIDLF
jgi:hypothetical protein